MFKSVTFRNDRTRRLRTARVMLTVSDPGLRACLEAAVLAAIEAHVTPDGARMVHMRDVGRARPDDRPPPGSDAGGCGSADELEEDGGGGEDDDGGEEAAV